MEFIMDEALDKRIVEIKEIIRQEILVFKETGHKFLNKEITSAQFKPDSGAMGVYAQRSGKEFMLRLRVLSGVMDLKTLAFLQDIVKEYALDFIHFTTRQTVQLHNLQFDDMISIMEKCLEQDIITRGGGGNYPRNVSLSPLSGVEEGEAFDVTPYALFVNKYFVSQINTYKLPRKFKVAFSNGAQDSANATIADIGFLAVNHEGNEYFKVYIGGSLGVNAEQAILYDELVDPGDVLYHIEAALSLFREEGDYENKSKARIRYIVKRLGKEAFLECYKKHLEQIKKTQELEIQFKQMQEERAEGADYEIPMETVAAIPQKQKHLYSVEIHPQGGILYTDAFHRILAFLSRVDNVQVRLSMEESMVVRNLTAIQAEELLELTKDIRMTTRLNRSISCIGVPICQIGVQSSQTLLADLINYFKEKGMTEDLLPSIAISGCVNSCARHQTGKIGFMGKKKRVKDTMEDVYLLYVDGETSEKNTRLAKEYGDLPASDIPEFLFKLALCLKDRQLEFEQYLMAYEEEFNALVSKYVVVS